MPRALPFHALALCFAGVSKDHAFKLLKLCGGCQTGLFTHSDVSSHLSSCQKAWVVFEDCLGLCLLTCSKSNQPNPRWDLGVARGPQAWHCAKSESDPGGDPVVSGTVGWFAE